MSKDIINKIEVREYSKEYKESIINLLGYLLKGYNESKKRELFEWRYERNPYQSKQIMLLAFSENLLVGFRAYLVQYFCIYKKKITVISPADTIIHPEFRRLGLISMLNKKSLDLIYSEYPEESILLNSTTSRNAMPTYLKLDWIPCSNKNKVYGYKISIVNFLRVLLKTNPKFKYKTNLFSFSNSGYFYEISNKINTQSVVEFIREYRDKTKFSNLRDEAFFNWRYSYESDKYIFCVSYFNETMVGYIIIKKLSRYQFSVEEFLAKDIKVAKLIFKTLQKQLKIPIMRTIIFSNEDKKFMKFLGFFIESNFYIKLLKKQRFPVLVRPTKPALSESDFFIQNVDIRNIENWQLYQSDRH